MTRFENASPAARLALALAGLACLAALGSIGAVLIALAGLNRLSPDIDLTRVPAWLWYYRHDPDLQRWLGIGSLISALLVGITGVAVALSRKRPLHGGAR